MIRPMAFHRPAVRALGAVVVAASVLTAGGLATPTSVHAADNGFIKVTPVHQQYPLDCEAAALQMALSAISINVSQNWLLQRFGADLRLPVLSGGLPVRWGDPYQTFVGNVSGNWLTTGYGVYYPPIAAAAQAAGAVAVGHEGWSPAQLYDEVALGHPVVVRVSHLLHAVWVRHWTAWDGRSVWYSGQDHAQTLIGFDKLAQTVTLADPLDGLIHTYSMPLFENRFAAFMGSAVVISPGPGLHFAPLSGASPASSAIAVSDSAIQALAPRVSSFGSPQTLSTTRFYGSRVTLFANLLGPGKPAAAVAVNDSSIWVMTKVSSSSFGPPRAWSSVAFFGSRATLMSDIDGSGFDSAVAINDTSIWVMRNHGGTGFDPPVKWSNAAFYGGRGTFMAVIDSSGRASAVAINDTSIWVMPNQGGTAFGPPQLRSSGAFYGNRGTFMADVDGSGKASAVAMNDNSIWVKKNNGAGSFASPTRWSSQPFYAVWQYLADVDGSGRASAIAVSRTAIWVEQNTGAGFGPPVRWYGAAFSGTR